MSFYLILIWLHLIWNYHVLFYPRLWHNLAKALVQDKRFLDKCDNSSSQIMQLFLYFSFLLFSTFLHLNKRQHQATNIMSIILQCFTWSIFWEIYCNIPEVYTYIRNQQYVFLPNEICMVYFIRFLCRVCLWEYLVSIILKLLLGTSYHPDMR